MLDVPALADPAAASAATYLACALHALVREEHVGRRPRRLLEPNLATWQRFRGRMGSRDLVELILEDAAVAQPEPFAAAALLGRDDPFEALPDALIDAWLAEIPTLPDEPSRGDTEALAARLGLTSRPAFADLSTLRPHHRVLELPGTGGRLAAHVVQTQPGISLKDVFTIACATWQERMLAGLIAVGSGVVGDVRITVDPDLATARRTEGGFTHVFGLGPDKGGRFTLDVLEGWFPSATIVLV